MTNLDQDILERIAKIEAILKNPNLTSEDREEGEFLLFVAKKLVK